MPVGGVKPGLLARLVGWMARTLSAARAVRSTAPTMAPLLPAIFLSRAPVAAPVRQPPVSAAPSAAVRASAWAFAARLQSVAKQNVPKALKATPALRPGPAGKAIPKKSRDRLKRYKPSDAGVVLAASARAPRLAGHASNVIDLAEAVRRRVAQPYGGSMKRAA